MINTRARAGRRASSGSPLTSRPTRALVADLAPGAAEGADGRTRGERRAMKGPMRRTNPSADPSAPRRPGLFTSRNPALAATLERVKDAAVNTRQHILITGPPGSGKS